MVAQGRGSGYDQEGLGTTHATDVGTVLYDTDVWTLDDVHRMRPEMILNMRAGVYRRALVNLSNDPNSLRGLVLMYGRERDAGLPSSIKSVVPELVPHFVKAIEVNRFTHELQRKYQAVLSVLDKVATGVMVLSPTGDVILSNRTAKEVAEADEGIAITRSGNLAFRNPDTGAEFREKVRSVSQTAAGENSDTGRRVLIATASNDTPIIALIAPLRDANMEIEKGLTGALVTLIDPKREVKIELETLARAYKLTPSELRAAGYLVKGLSNSAISERLDRSPETIKTQLSSIYQKCGCKNRIEFLWRVFQLSPPIL